MRDPGPILDEGLTAIPRRAACVLGVLPGLLLAEPSRADLILQPYSITTTMGAELGWTGHIIDRSGLNAGYTSLATDFDAYLGANPTHNDQVWTSAWMSSIPTGTLDFWLGGTFTVQSFALWNRGGSFDSNVMTFRLLADSTLDFDAPVLLGSFSASAANWGTANAARAEVFSFAPTSAKYVRMEILSNNGNPHTTAMKEAAFEVLTPAPGSAAPALVAGAVGLRRRRRGEPCMESCGPRHAGPRSPAGGRGGEPHVTARA